MGSVAKIFPMLSTFAKGKSKFLRNLLIHFLSKVAKKDVLTIAKLVALNVITVKRIVKTIQHI